MCQMSPSLGGKERPSAKHLRLFQGIASSTVQPLSLSLLSLSVLNVYRTLQTVKDLIPVTDTQAPWMLKPHPLKRTHTRHVLFEFRS